VLSHGATTNNHDVQEMALSAIASTAAAAAVDFAPYVGAVRGHVWHTLLCKCALALRARGVPTHLLDLLFPSRKWSQRGMLQEMGEAWADT